MTAKKHNQDFCARLARRPNWNYERAKEDVQRRMAERKRKP